MVVGTGAEQRRAMRGGMKRWGMALLATVAPGLAVAAGADLQTVHIRGKPLSIFGNPDTGYVAVFNGRAVPLGDDAEQAVIHKLVSGGGKTYAITRGNCLGHGDVCTPDFHVLDVSTDDILVAPKALASGAYESDRWDVRGDGTLVGTVQKLDGNGTLEYDYRDGQLSELDHPPPAELEGAAEPPGGDYVALLNDEEVSHALHLKAFAPHLRALVPGPVFEDIAAMSHQMNYSFGKPNAWSDFVYAELRDAKSGTGWADIAVASDGQITVAYWAATKPGQSHYDVPPDKIWGPTSPAFLSATRHRQ